MKRGKNLLCWNQKGTNKKHRDNFDNILPNAYVHPKFRKPTAPPTKAFRDKSKYTRKKKHKHKDE